MTPAHREHGPTRIVVVGDALLDRDLVGAVSRVAPDAPVPVVADPVERRRPGGAALAAALAVEDGIEVTLVAAIADDDAARALRRALADAGVTVVALPTDDATGEKVRIQGRGQVLLRVDHGGAVTAPRGWTSAAQVALDAADAVLVADYGRGVGSCEPVRRALAQLVARRVPLVWDPHPRGALPVAGARLVTPNRSEATALCPVTDPEDGLADLARIRLRADRLRRTWEAGAVCVTLGPRGALLVGGDGTPLVVPAPPTGEAATDTCGAGDRFASAAAVALARGALPTDAVVAAVHAATQFVSSGAAGAFVTPGSAAAAGRSDEGTGTQDPPFGETAARAVIDRVRRHGGTVVATGGCFDLLHAGHVQLLRSARQLGDALIVCINDDASVRNLKGPGRPVTRQADRMAVLAGLEAVDAVVAFGESTPEALLDRLRPDVWAKGADYAVADLPEAPLVSSWGGQAVVLPYLSGRSTTAILQEVQREH